MEHRQCATEQGRAEAEMSKEPQAKKGKGVTPAISNLLLCSASPWKVYTSRWVPAPEQALNSCWGSMLLDGETFAWPQKHWREGGGGAIISFTHKQSLFIVHLKPYFSTFSSRFTNTFTNTFLFFATEHRAYHFFFFAIHTCEYALLPIRKWKWGY